LSTLVVAQHESRYGYVEASWAAIVATIAATCVCVPLATLLLVIRGKADVLGIHHLSVTSPYHLLVWCALLILEPVVTLYRFRRDRDLLIARQRRTGHPLQVRPPLTRLAEKLLDTVANADNYVHRR